MYANRKEAETAAMSERVDEFRHGLLTDADAMRGLMMADLEDTGMYAASETPESELALAYADIASIIYLCAPIFGMIAAGDPISKVWHMPNFRHFQTFLRLQKGIIDNMDGILQNAVASKFLDRGDV